MPLFREVQRFRQPWIWVILLGAVGWATWAVWRQVAVGVPVGTNPMSDAGLLAVWLLLVIFALGFLLVLHLRTEVRPDGVHVRFFPFHLRERSFPLDTLAEVEAVEYRPLLEYGGWGIRIGPKGWAYNVSGRRGVRFVFTDGRRLLVGSRRPEAFVDAIEEALAVGRPRGRR